MGHTMLVRACLGVLVLGLWACGDDDGGKPNDAGAAGNDGGPSDAAPMGGSGGSGGTSGGAGTGVPALMCGGDACTISAGAAMLGTTACCAEDDACGGMMSVLSTTCLALGAQGNLDQTCPDVSLAAGAFTLGFPGCCTPSGVCGALDSSAGGFGCIPNDALAFGVDGGVGQSCTYDPTATCTSIMAAYCDGPEDCPGDQQCCGQFGGGGYASFTCEDSCVELAQQGEVWSEICHPGQECDQPLPTDGGMPGGQMPALLPDGGLVPYECRVGTMYLPEFWPRCRDTGTEPTEAGSTAAGEINCGEDVCGAGQKCCYALEESQMASQGVAHCAPADAPCTCSGSGGGDDAGSEDGG